MTTEQAIKQIISTPKFYIGVMKQSTASRMIKRILNGSASVNNRRKFMESFGYKDNGQDWVK